MVVAPRPQFGSLTDAAKCPDALPLPDTDNRSRAIYVSRRFEREEMCAAAFAALREKALDVQAGNSAK